MTAVAEMDLAAVEAFQMPRPGRCAPVLWFPHGHRSDTPEVAFVMKVGARNIELRLGSGTFRTAVRHVDDPKLKLSEAQRENGAWDFGEDHKERLELKHDLAVLHSKVALLEARLEARSKAKKDE